MPARVGEIDQSWPAPAPGDGFQARTVYARATDPEGAFPGGRLLEEIRAELTRLPAEPAPPDLDLAQRQARAWSFQETGRCLGLLERTAEAGARRVLVRRAALGCAPLALISGAWLQWMSNPGNADDPVALRLLTIYASDVGVGAPRASRGSAYLALLRHLTRSEHAAPAARLTLDQRIADAAFYLPALLLVMSRRPDEFMPEILGADLCLRSVGLLPALTLVRHALPMAADWSALDPNTTREDGQPAEAERVRGAVQALLAEGGPGAAERVRLGFGWALAGLRHWSGELYAELEAARDPAYDMAELLRLRAREGAIYHQSYRLAGRPLSAWLQDSRTDPQAMLRALAASSLVKPGRSRSSPLVNSLVRESGPMFRVFAPEDLTVIRRWIDSLPRGGPAAGSEPSPVAPASPGLPPLLLPSLGTPVGEEDRRPGSLREAYARLHQRRDTPALRRFAVDYVRRWLARSRRGIERAANQLPAQWGPQGLRPWLLAQHARHDREFQSTAQAPLPSREALIDSTVQLAPLTLIDGSWLRGFTDYEYAASETGYFLFHTYWDELGNGEARLNHPLIYREVLAEMGIRLPPTGSPEFASWPGFRELAFELPVYWLSLGRFPRTFMPEILGLNVAMELSGVGGTYRRSQIALKAYGFSTRFVDIHNTIDNVAAGHSAWAADAVDSYMAALPLSQGAGARAEAWDRIRVGYRSLNPPTGFWVRQVARLAPHAGEPRWSRLAQTAAREGVA